MQLELYGKYCEYCVKFRAVKKKNLFLGIGYILGFEELVFHVLSIVYRTTKEISMPVWK